jgi:CubicO group peptidase (beta-lactamase class C family)
MTRESPAGEVHGAAVTPGFLGSGLERLRNEVREQVAAGAIPGAVLWIAHHGSVAFFEAHGFAERATSRPLQVDSIYRIASMTKPMTAVAALLLQEQGKLLLADPIRLYLPELRDLKVGVEFTDDAGERRLRLDPPHRALTVQDLMRHTAGFTYGDFGDSLVQRAYRRAKMLDPFQSNAEMVTKLAQLPLAAQPGSTFEYGMSTDVLGRVVEVVAGQPLDRVFAETITGPLGMVDTAFAVPAASKARMALPHRVAAAGGEPRPAPVPVPVPAPAPAPATAAAGSPDTALRGPRWCSGGGGLASTAADYGRFCQMLLNGGELDGCRLLSRKSVELMTHDHLPRGIAYAKHSGELGLGAPLPDWGQGYGLGVGVRLTPGLSSVPGSVGDFYWSGITGPCFWVDPKERLVVVMMLAEPDRHRRNRWHALLRALVYQALR